MPTPPKPYSVLKGEKKSHRTKAELELRKQGEESLSSSEKMKERAETKANEVAHKEFLRVKKLLEIIEKNDALYEPVINRYCIIQAECRELEERKEVLNTILSELKNEINNLPKEEKAVFLMDLTQSIAKVAGQMALCDKLLAQKRKMLFDIEKENIMTIASALRTIPKKVEDKKNELLEALKKG